MSILEDIFAHKLAEVAQRRQTLPINRLAILAARAPGAPDFIAALTQSNNALPHLIAEIKRRSPSKGLLRAALDPPSLAATYAANGAAAISILTDNRYFGGSLDDLKSVSDMKSGLPLLRKDFIYDPYQLLEARLYGASAVLLIAAMLAPDQLRRLVEESQALSMTPLVEVHSEIELELALMVGAKVIGINNRDLHTFSVDLETSLRLASQVPEGKLLVAESGIRTLEDAKRLAVAGFHAMLVGEALVVSADPGAMMRRLLGLRKVQAP